MIIRRAPKKEAFTSIDGCKIVEVIGLPTTNTREVSLAQAKIKGKTRTLRHYHTFTEIYMVVAGEGIMHIDREAEKVKLGDNVLIPAKAHHFIENKSEQDLVIWCICTPAFTPDGTTLTEKSV